MIEKVVFGDLSRSSLFGYAKELPFFVREKEISFKPGLNIMFTPNGTGKSTILDMMALSTASKQGGISTITHSWEQKVHSIFDKGRENTKMGDIVVWHDGQPVAYCNPRDAVGLIGGRAGFDDDFFSQGLDDLKLRESTGKTSLYRLTEAMEYLDGSKQIPDVYHRSKRYHDWGKGLPPAVSEIMKAKIPTGQKTLLLDEPESGVSIESQAKLWAALAEGAEKQNLQVIVATHSVFALGCKANFVELEPNYPQTARAAIQALTLKL
ncbi:Vitamin B12 import ATP-binding protein BtuD [compost metagenome]